MVNPVRAVLTFLGVAASGFLIWLSTHFIADSSLGDYWIKIGLLAGAGLALPLSQLFGGWTKWGWPRFSPHVLLLGFLPAFLVAGWVILAGQPDANWFQDHITTWSHDLHVARLVRHLREGYLDVLAFGLGTVFGFSFDTTGPAVKPRTRAGGPGEGGPADATTRTAPVAAAGAAPVVRPPSLTETRVAPQAAETEVVAPPAEETAVTRVSEPESDEATTIISPEKPPTEP